MAASEITICRELPPLAIPSQCFLWLIVLHTIVPKWLLAPSSSNYRLRLTQCKLNKMRICSRTKSQLGSKASTTKISMLRRSQVNSWQTSSGWRNAKRHFCALKATLAMKSSSQSTRVGRAARALQSWDNSWGLLQGCHRPTMAFS